MISDRGQVLGSRALHRVLGAVVNLGRSIPFIILLVLVIPVTRAVVGTTIGTPAAIVPPAIATVPFFARVVETALREVPAARVAIADAPASGR